MGYRDDLDAALARVAALEAELERAREQLVETTLRAQDFETQAQRLRAELEIHRMQSRSEFEIDRARYTTELEHVRATLQTTEALNQAQREVIEALEAVVAAKRDR